MEGLTRLVTESLARHGFDRPLDYRRLRWSRWFRCESTHSLLFVPSQPGIFALAEEVISMPDPGAAEMPSSHRSPGDAKWGAQDAEARRMLAVSQFFEADDMAFVLDRMLSYQNPMRARLASGRYFVRYVVIEDESQRRNIAGALNQWILSSSEKATGIGSHFASSLELTATESIHAGTASAVQRAVSEANGSFSAIACTDARTSPTAPQPDPGAATNINGRSPFPAGF
jgi:hypothetical protein